MFVMGHLLTCVMRKNKCVAGVIVALNRRALNVGESINILGSGINLLGEAIYNGLSYRIFGRFNYFFELNDIKKMVYSL